MRNAWLLFCGLLSLVSTAHSAHGAAQRVEAFAKLPDWTGYWESEIARLFVSPSGHLEGAGDGEELGHSQLVVGHPPLNAHWEHEYQMATSDPAAIAAAAAAAASGKSCSIAFPMVMDWSGFFQAVVTPEETLLVFSTGAVRHVYTDGRLHPVGEELWPTRMGDSIGSWQGDTLVIDTVARSEGRLGVGPNSFSAQAHFVERLRRVNNDTFEDKMTIDDPTRYSRPWQLTFRYSRVTDLNRMIPWDCEYDRNPVVNGKLTIEPP
jgi:hypothetical protein